MKLSEKSDKCKLKQSDCGQIRRNFFKDVYRSPNFQFLFRIEIRILG